MLKTKRALKNMLHRGLEQSDRIILDNLTGFDATIKRSIYNRIENGANITEVMILTENNKFRTLYKKSKD